MRRPSPDGGDPMPMTPPPVDLGQQEIMDGAKRPAGEPDTLQRGAGADATPPARSSKEAIWKSVIGATGGFGCERETFYRETVRDHRGYRLRFGAGESMLFGVAIDAAHGYLMGRRFTYGPEDVSWIGIDTSDEGYGEPVLEEQVREIAGAATQHGYEKARARERSEPWTDEDWVVFHDRVGLAIEKLLGLWPNRVKEVRGGTEALPEPEGTPEGPPIGWLDPGSDIHTHAQRKMHAPDVVGGRGITGQPDYVFTRDGTIVGWVDVKALGKAGSYPAKWAAGEAVAYDYLCSVENGGVLPEQHGYLEYRRVAKPYWALITAPVNPSVLALASAYFTRWERALDGNDPDAVSFNLRNCGRCEYREAINEGARLLHPGCPIGGPSLDVAPPAGEDEG